MAYISNGDIEERLGHDLYVQLTDDEGSGTADEDKVDEARLGAEGEVDSYLGRRHAVPIDLAACPELAGVIRSVTLDLAEYRLHCRRSPVPEPILSKRIEAVRWLERVAAGEAVLPAARELPANPAAGLAARSVGDPRILTRDEIRDL